MPASIRDRRVPDDRAVTAVVGTVLVLALTVTGILAALVFGTPLVQRLQDRAALNSVAGQMQSILHDSSGLATVNASRSSGLALPGGTLTLGPGTHVAVTVDYGSLCDFRVSNWTDWDTAVANTSLSYTAVGCSATTFQVYNVTGATQTLQACSCASPGYLNLSAGAAYNRSTDYLVRANASGIIQAEAWILHMDRLSWRRDTATQVEADLEGGALFGRQEGRTYRVAGPRADEGNAGTSLSLSFQTFQDSRSAAVADHLEHSLYQALASRNLRVDSGVVYKVRLEFHGDLAESWCNAFLQRNAALDITNPRYVQDASKKCSPTTPPTDGVRGLTFALPSATAFPFRLAQPVYHAAIQA